MTFFTYVNIFVESLSPGLQNFDIEGLSFKYAIMITFISSAIA